MAYDTNLVLYTSGSSTLTTTATGTAIDFGAPDHQALTYDLNVPCLTSGSGTITATLLGGSTSALCTNTFADFEVLDSAGMSSTSGSLVHVTAKTPYQWRKVVLTVAADAVAFGSATLPVTVTPTQGGRYDKF